MKINYKFVPHGTAAPNHVDANEFWLDVGDRSAPQVLDHHGGDTSAMSTFELIINKYKEHILSCLDPMKDITIVLHTSPDLDSISSVWLFTKIVTQPEIFETNYALKIIERAVGENDQGLVRTNNPKTNWAIVFRTILMIPYSKVDNLSKLLVGIELIEKTYILLEKGNSLEDAAQRLITKKIEISLEQAKLTYEKDLLTSDIFQVVLPKRKSLCFEEFLFSKQKNDFKQKTKADALILHNPESILFKELARGDVINSPQKKGFDLLIVSRDVTIQKDRTLKRYIISTDPLSGFNLKGLGAKLEILEQTKEESMGLPLMKGRERLDDRSGGRYGHNVKAAWYDGRGHNYTIVDSPAIEYAGKIYCASCLAIEEIKFSLFRPYL